jgi:hypothetical protein
MTVRCVLTDNGHGYRSRAWRAACHQLGIHHHRTRDRPHGSLNSMPPPTSRVSHAARSYT